MCNTSVTACSHTVGDTIARGGLNPGAAVLCDAPLISVVMTTYRDEWSSLRTAVESILAQTLSDLEFIVVFEGDDKNYGRILNTFDDARLFVKVEPQGIGRNECLNRGLSLARGRYLARMDGDDRSYSERLHIEVDYLRRNPDVSVVGSAGRLMNENGEIVGIRRFPEDHASIVRAMAFTTPIFHPSVVWDRERVGYDLQYACYHSDDTELWLRLLHMGHRFSNLPNVLIDYEQPPNYTRPLAAWRGFFQVRLLHWRLCLKYPRFLLGLVLLAGLSVMPACVVNAVTRRSRFSDYMRSIKSG
jgi:glycosyltransferase involved in cell wall biosynthesis